MAAPNLSTRPRADSALIDRLRMALLRIGRKLRSEGTRHGASQIDIALMGMIFKHPGIGVSDLAEHEHTTRPTMSAHVKRLEAAGWVTRTISGDDRRRAGLELTAKGLRMAELVRKERTSWLIARIETLSAEEYKALAAAAGALEKLAGPMS